jgi:hypothetical protein
LNSEADALAAAEMLAVDSSSFEHRQPWCSEAISYWHRESGVPYTLGYYIHHGWHTDWLVKSVTDLRTWYETEEASGGRGRWIEAKDVDYVDFQPGINAPAPGSYMAWTGYDEDVATRSGEYYAFEISHSLMIDEMWIHRDAHGNVFRVKVSFLEGNSNNRVLNSREWEDLLSFTPQGSDWIGWKDGPDGISHTTDDIGIKIYGFGIDLDAQGDPIIDETRLHYVDHGYLRHVSAVSFIPEDDTWNNQFAFRLPSLTALASLLRQNNGPVIECTSEQMQCDSLPDGLGNKWSFPQGLNEELTISIDFLAPNPLPLESVRMLWDPVYVPQNFQVWVGDAAQNYTAASLPQQYQVPQTSSPVPLSASLSQPTTGIRYLRFVFPAGTFSIYAAEMVALTIPYDEGTYGDADEVPDDLPVFVDIEPGTCPNIVRSAGNGPVTIAILGGETLTADGILPGSLLFNGQPLQPLSYSYQYAASPFIGSAPGCHTLGDDEYIDLVLEYDREEFAASLGLDSLGPGKHLSVRVSGTMNDNYGYAPIQGRDFVKTPPSLPLLLLLGMNN